MAQLEYLLPRLTRQWTHLSRLGGGIGTRGSRARRSWKWTDGAFASASAISKHRLETVERTARAATQETRHESARFRRVALVGYTNAGKSTLMNTLTPRRRVLSDKLFATSIRRRGRSRLPSGDKVMIVDTVGFIHKIPHSLDRGVQSTLEEVSGADLLLHLVDLANPLFEEQVHVIERCWTRLAPAQIPYDLLVPNKTDRISLLPIALKASVLWRQVCPISALTGAGVDAAAA